MPSWAPAPPRSGSQLGTRQNGYDSPLWYQYWVFLDHLVHGNLGFSYKLNRSVDSIIASDLPRDVLLVGTSLVLAVVIAVPVGVMQAVKRNRGFDYAGTATAFVLYSMPSYALGLILIALFAITIKALPAGGPAGDDHRVHARPSRPGSYCPWSR